MELFQPTVFSGLPLSFGYQHFKPGELTTCAVRAERFFAFAWLKWHTPAIEGVGRSAGLLWPAQGLVLVDLIVGHDSNALKVSREGLGIPLAGDGVWRLPRTLRVQPSQDVRLLVQNHHGGQHGSLLTLWGTDDLDAAR